MAMTWDGMYVYLGKVELITQSSKGKRAGMCSFYVKSCNRFVFRSSHSSFKQLENI